MLVIDADSLVTPVTQRLPGVEPSHALRRGQAFKASAASRLTGRWSGTSGHSAAGVLEAVKRSSGRRQALRIHGQRFAGDGVPDLASGR